eukprot:449443_1
MLSNILIIAILSVSQTNANSCVIIPAGSIVESRNYFNYKIGPTICNYCSINFYKNESTMYTCSGSTGKYMTYNGINCNNTPSKTYNIIINGKCYNSLCIGYNSVMYNYTQTQTECEGNIESNITVYGPWILNECMNVTTHITIEKCQNGQPIDYLWLPPNLNCSGPPDKIITYNQCTPPASNHTEMLTLLVNPCI